MMDQTRETMNEIERLDQTTLVVNNKDALLTDILNLEKNIRTAEEAIKSDRAPYGHTPVSPEQANKKHRDIVFMKKNLANAKTEYEELQ